MFKKTASRSMAALIFVAGSLWLAYLGQQPVPSYVSLNPWSSTVGLLLAGALPLVAAIVALSRPKAASLIVLPAVPILIVWFLLAGVPLQLAKIAVAQATADPAILAVMFSLFVVPGFIWLLMSRLHWPPVFSTLTMGKVAGAVTLIVSLVLPATVLMDLYSRDFGECHYSLHPFTQQQRPHRGVFAARVVSSGLGWPSRAVAKQWPDSQKKYWAIATV